MPRRKSETRSQSMEGNQNAEKETPERELITLSLTSYRKERIRAAIEFQQGYIPEDEEVITKARQLAYLAWDAYYRQIEKEQEEAIII